MGLMVLFDLFDWEIFEEERYLSGDPDKDSVPSGIVGKGSDSEFSWAPFVFQRCFRERIGVLAPKFFVSGFLLRLHVTGY